MILGRVNLVAWVERSETHGAASVGYAASPLTPNLRTQSGTTAVVSISSLAAGSTRRVTATKAIAG